MGVPKLFKIILDKFPKSHAKVDNQPIDYLFIDFNSIIYESYESIKKPLIGLKNITKDFIESKIIEKVIAINLDIITNYVKPLKMVYFAFDGVPVRAKMIQQRDRRYKRLYENTIKHQILNNYKISNISIDQAYSHIDEIDQSDEDVVIDSGELWNTTNITPGTEFMLKVSLAMNKAIIDEIFPINLEYILSDTSVPGEGEHKFLIFIDHLDPCRISIYSNDGDVIMLVNRFPQHQVFILTKPKDTSRVVQKYYQNDKFMYLVIAGINDGFVHQFNRLDLQKVDLQRLKIDYIFFSFFGGNDFVIHLYFLRMKDDHSFNVLKGIYQSIYPTKGHMVNSDLTINQGFLMEYLISLAKQELIFLKKKQIEFQNPNVSKNTKKDSKFDALAPWEKQFEIFQHTPFYKSEHPLYKELASEFKKINYNLKPNSVWKNSYYEAFFNVKYSDRKAINNICYQYLKSLIFTFRYYMIEVPSWTWYYPYHASPLPSDLVNTLRNIKDINTAFTFNKSLPFKPLEQLMLILPKKTDLLNEKFIKIMDKFPQYYPETIKFDPLWGQKFIYSEPTLPNINSDEVLKEFKKIKLNSNEKLLNTLNELPLFFGYNQ